MEKKKKNPTIEEHDYHLLKTVVLPFLNDKFEHSGNVKESCTQHNICA